MKWISVDDRPCPKDGGGFDVWCVPPEDSEFEPIKGGVRFADVYWVEQSEFWEHTGYCRCTDDGNWDMIEMEATCDHGCPAWVVTHWMPLPDPPQPESEDG